MEIRSMDRYLAGPARAASRVDVAQGSGDLPERIRGFGNQDINGIVVRQGGGQFELRLQFGREIVFTSAGARSPPVELLSQKPGLAKTRNRRHVFRSSYCTYPF